MPKSPPFRISQHDTRFPCQGYSSSLHASISEKTCSRFNDTESTARPEHSGHFIECLRNRIQIAEHIGAEHRVEAVIGKREELPNSDHSPPRRVEQEHLRRWVQGEHLAVPEHRISGPGTTTEIQDPPCRQQCNDPTPPVLFLPERQDPVDPVVLAGDVGEDRPVAQDQPIVSKPT